MDIPWGLRFLEKSSRQKLWARWALECILVPKTRFWSPGLEMGSPRVLLAVSQMGPRMHPVCKNSILKPRARNGFSQGVPGCVFGTQAPTPISEATHRRKQPTGKPTNWRSQFTGVAKLPETSAPPRGAGSDPGAGANREGSPFFDTKV
jgi:hypothetical protein